MTETPLEFEINAWGNKLKSLIEDWGDTLERNFDEWVYVDGEEGDYGYVHYSENGKRCFSMVSKGGDDDSIEMTEYGLQRALEMIRENWEPMLMASLPTIKPSENA